MKKFKNAFDWDINQTPIFNAQGEIIKGYKEISRNDDDSLIAVMKKSYTPMTTQQFSDTVEQIAKNIGADVAGYEDWQTNKQFGRPQHVITAQLEMSEPLSIAGSKIQGFLTIGSGFDGGRSFFVGHTNNYMRCSNEFGSIISAFTSRLTKNNLLRVEDIVKNIEIYSEYEKELYASFERFQNVQIDDKIIKECVARLVKMTDEERVDSSLISTQKLNKMDDIMASVRGECAELGNNAWGLFNACTHYSTHVMNSRNQDMFGNMFGSKAMINKTGYDFCNELINS
ncbi:MAG: DUF932 domain-containing protein [Candidatus Heimdallarchaeaceae archaeon]